MSSDLKQVFVLGAGFTRAFLPKAPLLVDYYFIDDVIEKYTAFPDIANILESERNKRSDGRIDIERLFTRIYSGMPYDSEGEFNSLIKDIKTCFMQRFFEAKQGIFHSTQLATFAKYCIENHIDCITFNYDDILDQALWEVEKAVSTMSAKTYWHPDGGYGFFCRPSIVCVTDTNVHMDDTAMHLFKLHGSANWFVRFGSTIPYTVDALVHNDEWFPSYGVSNFDNTSDRKEDILEHLEKEPFIVPPVLVKSAIMQQPILKLVWRLAYKTLRSAQKVTFIGYSLPITDVAAGFLFEESLRHLQGSQVEVVNLPLDKEAKKTLKDSYRRIFPDIPDRRFKHVDALDWSQGLVQTNKTTA